MRRIVATVIVSGGAGEFDLLLLQDPVVGTNAEEGEIRMEGKEGGVGDEEGEATEGGEGDEEVEDNGRIPADDENDDGDGDVEGVLEGAEECEAIERNVVRRA